MGPIMPISFCDTVFLNLVILVLRFISVFILKEIIRLLLRRDNSISTLRKAKRECTFWSRITGLCFWNMKSSCKKILHFFIGYRVLMVTTVGFPLLLAISSCFEAKYEIVSAYSLRIAFYMDMIVMIPMAIYACTLYNRKKD